MPKPTINHPPIKSKAVIKETGVCQCIYEPRGDNGLEGYQRDEMYSYQLKHSAEDGDYYKVFPEEGSAYGETCGKRIFKRHFKIVSNSLEDMIEAIYHVSKPSAN